MINNISLIIFALLFEGFFSGSETALISSNLMRLIHLKETGRKRATAAYGLLKRPDKLLATTLVGTNLAVVLSSSLATFLCVHLFNDKGSLVATLAMTPLVLIFGEIIPKALGRQHANQAVLFVAFPLAFFQKIFAPAVWFVGSISRMIMRLLRVQAPEKNPFITKEEIKFLIAEIVKEGILEEKEQEAIQRIFEFTITKAGDVMTPLNKMVVIDYTETAEQIMNKVKDSGFTRLPVFKDKQIYGLINIFDIFYNQNTPDWRQFIRNIRQADIELRLDKLFSQMKSEKESMYAITKDNKCAGIITIEDIMEEVICKICE